jgi:hypothetical protein
MNGMAHLKYMVFGGAAAFAVALLLGVPAQSALTLAFVLACPLMMVVMMVGDNDHGASGRDDDHSRSSDAVSGRSARRQGSRRP